MDLGDARIGGGETPGITPRAADKSAVESALGIVICSPRRRLEFLHGTAYIGDLCSRGQPFPEAHGDGIGNAARKLPEKTIAFETEDAAPDAVEIDWNNRRVHPFDDAFHAAA